MNGDAPTPGRDDPVRHDDELLDALRRGTPPPPDDPVAALLAGWHTEIETRAARLEAAGWPVPDEPQPAGRPEMDPAGPAPERPGVDPCAAGPAPAGGPEVDAGATGTAPGLRRTRPRAGRPRRRTRVLSGMALTIVTMTGGVWLGAARAEPDGLLWPVTELVWTDRAESLSAEREIDRLLDQARRDLGAGRYGEARADLDRAAGLLAHLGDDRRADRLRTDLEDLRDQLPAPVGPASPAPPATLPGVPTAPPSTGTPAGDPSAATPSAVVPSDDAPPPERPAAPRPGHPEPASPATAPAGTAPVTGAGRPADAPARPAPGAGRPADNPATPGADRPDDTPATPAPGSGRPTGTATPPGGPATDGAATARPPAGSGGTPAADRPDAGPTTAPALDAPTA